MHTMDNFHTERFIFEIRSRPSIWDSSSSDYSDRDLKRKCWEEVVDLFVVDEKTLEQKRNLGIVLQKRWKSIRSCYAREVKRQKNLKSGFGVTDRKSEYIYFKQLQFLQKVVAIREEDVEEESAELGERFTQKVTNKRRLTEDDEPYVPAINNSTKQCRRETTEQRILETTEVDEDRMFLLSLLSTLKTLPPQVKMTAKIKTLTLLNDASGYSGNSKFDADRSLRQTSEVDSSGGRMIPAEGTSSAAAESDAPHEEQQSAAHSKTIPAEDLKQESSEEDDVASPDIEDHHQVKMEEESNDGEKQTLKDIATQLQALNKRLDDDTCGAFGRYVAAVMRSLPAPRAMAVQPRIVHLLVEAVNDADDSTQ